MDLEGAEKRSTERIRVLEKMPDGVRNYELDLFSLYERRLRNALITLHNRENTRYETAV